MTETEREIRESQPDRQTDTERKINRGEGEDKFLGSSGRHLSK